MSTVQVAAISMLSATTDMCIFTDMTVLPKSRTLRARAKKSPNGRRTQTSASRTHCAVRRLTAPTQRRAPQQALARVGHRSSRMSTVQVAAISMLSATTDMCIFTDMVVLPKPRTLRARAKKLPGGRAKTSASRTLCVVRRLTALMTQRAPQQMLARVGWSSEHRSPLPQARVGWSSEHRSPLPQVGRLVEYSFCVPSATDRGLLWLMRVSLGCTRGDLLRYRSFDAGGVRVGFG